MKDWHKNILKKIKIGRVIYLIYFFPKGTIKRWLKWGLINTFLAYYGQKQMEKATASLKPITPKVSENLLKVYFLTGKKFWYQTCFCFYSLVKVANMNLIPVIHDDGTLEEYQIKKIKNIFPNVIMISNEEVEDRLDQCLPWSKFPSLRERRVNYPNIRKLTDFHAGSNGWKLALDSDMLFFKTPVFLLNWLKSSKQPCHAVDIKSNYGYSRKIMTSLVKEKIFENINVGICGLKNEDIDWEKLEFWCKRLTEEEGTHYLQEQALVAMLLAGKLCDIAPAEEYVVLPNREEVMNPKRTLHHYVDASKRWYFRYGWRHII